jgi:hypothetical protein
VRRRPPPGPAPDFLIRLYPTRFLNAVADAWADSAWAERALATYLSAGSGLAAALAAGTRHGADGRALPLAAPIGKLVSANTP